MKKAFIVIAVIILNTLSVCAAVVNTDAALKYNQGIDFYKIGQYDKAMDCFKGAISLDPNYIDAYYNLGAILEYLGQYDAALAIFKQIIVRQPNDQDSIYKAAWLSFQLGQYEKAKTYLSILPQYSTRASDAQELLAQINTKITTKPQAEVKQSLIKQTNNLYQNIESPTGITSDNQGNIYIAGFNDNTITKITPDDDRIGYIKDPRISGPIGLATDKDSNIYIANYNKDNVLKVSSSGEIITLINNVKKPYCIHIANNVLFVSCQGTNSVLKYLLKN